LQRCKIKVDGVNFAQTFLMMMMDTPIANRAFQVISALSQAARVDKVQAENFVEQGLVQRYSERPQYSIPAPMHTSAPSYPNAPQSMVEVVVSNGLH